MKKILQMKIDPRKKNSELVVILAILTLLLNQCISLEFHSPKQEEKQILAHKESECNTAGEYRYWTILYGTVPIRFLNKSPEEFLEGKSFRIKEKIGGLDFLISILGGFSTSISSKTIVIENCDAVKVEKLQEEIRKEETLQIEIQPDTKTPREDNTGKPQAPETKTNRTLDSEIVIDENSLLGENSKSSKKQDQKMSQKKKTKR